jgi:hypothetical protein
VQLPQLTALTRDHERWRTTVGNIAPGTLDNARAVYGL